jgi:hypothetical protein
MHNAELADSLGNLMHRASNITTAPPLFLRWSFFLHNSATLLSVFVTPCPHGRNTVEEWFQTYLPWPSSNSIVSSSILTSRCAPSRQPLTWNFLY